MVFCFGGFILFFNIIVWSISSQLAPKWVRLVSKSQDWGCLSLGRIWTPIFFPCNWDHWADFCTISSLAVVTGNRGKTSSIDVKMWWWWFKGRWNQWEGIREMLVKLLLLLSFTTTGRVSHMQNTVVVIVLWMYRTCANTLYGLNLHGGASNSN